MKRKLILMLLLTTSRAFSCDEQGAFGFEFGKPVPSDAEQFQYEGGSARNAAGCFYGALPEQLVGWEKYSYCANRDRKFVYALRASSKVEKGAEGREKARLMIIAAKEEWSKKYQLNFEQEFDSSFNWTAKTPKITASIYMLYGEEIFLECSHNELLGKAAQIALSSW